MWLLPADLSTIKLELPPGTHLLPWYAEESDIKRLIDILMRSLVGVRYHVYIPFKVLHLFPPDSLRSPEKSLVVVTIDREEPTLEIQKIVGQLKAKYLFIQYPRAQERGYTWRERCVKEPVIEAIEAHISDPNHPLADLDIKGLPVRTAADLSPDIVEIVDLLEATLAHRLRFADLGTSEQRYRRSLLLSVGRRLTYRLLPLELEDMGPAVELLLSRSRSTREAQRILVGAKALERVGLCRFINGEPVVAPLARFIKEPTVWGQLVKGLPREAWTPLAKELLRRLRTTEPIFGSAVSVMADHLTNHGSDFAQRIDMTTLRAHVATEMEEAEEGLAALDLLVELQELPPYVSAVPPMLDLRTRSIIGRLEVQEKKRDARGQSLIQALKWSINFWSARGPTSIEDQKIALHALEQAAIGLEETSPEKSCLSSARLEHARCLVVTPEDESDLVRAAVLASGEYERRPKDSPYRPHLELILGRVAQLRGQSADAELWYKRSLESFRNLGDRAAMAAVFQSLGCVAHDRGDLVLALNFYQKSLALMEEQQDQQGMALTFQQLGNLAFLQGKFDQGLEWFSKSLELFKAQGDLTGVSSSYRQMGTIHEKSGQFKKARDCYKSALEIDEQLGHRSHEAGSQHHMGNVSYFLGELDEATAWYRKSMSVFEELGNLTGMASAYHQLGLVAQKRGDTDEALRWYRKSLDIFKDQENRTGMAAVSHQLGMVARERGDDVGALKYFQRSLEIKQDQGDLFGTASSMSQIGVLYTQTGRPKEGVQWNLRSLTLRQQLGSQQFQVDLHWLAKQQKSLGEKSFRDLLEKHGEDPHRVTEIFKDLETFIKRKDRRTRDSKVP